MPIYDYVCGACSTTTEVVHGIHEEGPRFCPACGAKGRMKKAFAPPTIVFKGSGWAKKDRSSTSKAARSSSSSGREDAAAKAGTDGGTTAGTGQKEPAKDKGTSSAASTPSDD
jgi:putative FmdB family regulatory protein